MLVNNNHLTEINKPIQRIRARVELYRGSALEAVCTCGEVLEEFTLERTGENKFFGFGICQKLSGTLADLNKTLNITKEHTLEAAFGVNDDFVYPFPKFYVQEYDRDEVTGSISFTAYDSLFKAENYTFADLGLGEGYTVKAVALACATILQLPIRFINVNDDLLNTEYGVTTSANFSGSESVRRVLDAIAEFTQTIYYIDKDWELVFRRLNPAEEPVITIDASQYVDFDNAGERRLKNIVSVTEGEDNVDTVGEGEGVTQFIRDNPFLTLREDIATLLAQAQANVGGMSIAQFAMTWSGNYLVEIGDKIAMETEEGTITSYLLDDSISFNGGLFQETSWTFDENEGERATNPITLGEALNQTYIRVDKANKQINMLVSESNANKDAISTLQIDTGKIRQSVTEVQKNTDAKIEGINNNLTTVTNKVETMVTSETFEITVNEIIEDGVKKVDTTEGFVFDKNGLTIDKTGSSIKTNINENGMKVFRSGDEVLTADNEGVKAEDLHATTYLIVGANSRFENYGDNRTGCFWIGG